MSEVNYQDRTRLPADVYDLAIRLGANPALNRSSVKLHQTGQMKEIGAPKWMSFSAIQSMATRTCAFDWRARTGLFGMISVRDAFVNGEGHLAVKALGIIPIIGATSSLQLTRGELMRYLAELAWAPDAILFNDDLRWRQEGPDKLAVSAGMGDTAAEVILNLDTEGRIAGCFAPDRARAVKPPYLLTPWRGHFSDYRRHNDMLIPFAAEVAWEIDGVEHVYFQCTVDDWQTLGDSN